MSEENITLLLSWLDKTKSPLIFIETEGNQVPK